MSVLALFACEQNTDLLTDKVWYPVKITSRNDFTFVGLYAITFDAKGNRITHTLGTKHKDSSLYLRKEDTLYFNPDEKSEVLNFTVSEHELVLHFDSTTRVSYTDALPISGKDLTESLNHNLVAKSWNLNSNLIEFHEWLEKGPIKPALHEELNNGSYHFKNDDYYPFHENFVWGSSYLNGINFLIIGNILSEISNQYILVESVTDTLISGLRYDFQGKPEKVQLKAMVCKDIRPAIIGSWKLRSLKEIPSEFNEVWDSFGDDVGVSIMDLNHKNLSLTFRPDGSYLFSTSDKLFSKGKWHTDKSGKIIYLVADSENRNGLSYRTTYLSIISITDTALIIHKKEDVIQENGSSFERQGFIETYERAARE